MQNPKEYYSYVLAQEELLLKKINQKQLLFAMLRLVVFCCIILPFLIISGFIALKITFALIAFALFLFLVSYSANISLSKKFAIQKIKFIQCEIDALSGNYSGFGNGAEHQNSNHFFSYDLDLFGDESFFQTINKTISKEGEILLASTLASNNCENIDLKQKAIEELKANPEFILNFRTSLAINPNEISQSEIINFVENYQNNFSLHTNLVVKIYSAISLVAIALVTFNFVSWQLLLFPFFIGLAITGSKLKHVLKISRLASKLEMGFKSYAKCLTILSASKFQTTLNQFEILKSESLKPEDRFAYFSKILSALDQGNNILFALFANGFFLWNLKYAALTEQWITKNKNEVKNIFEMINHFEVYVSFGNYSFNHPEFNLPKLHAASEKVFEVQEIAHPMLSAKKVVTNNFNIDTKSFFVITGANMAGKSTFLRTIGISIMMANCGLPVRAKVFNYSPMKLISSMRSSDSLSKDESYFFAELKRLKFIVEQISMDNYFVILDEILKGTNSKDKEAGSRKFLLKIAKSNSCGLIATHDLTLCEVANENNKIKNYYFEAVIKNDELFFDYKLKEGICQNMNASFLLEKMNIV